MRALALPALLLVACASTATSPAATSPATPPAATSPPATSPPAPSPGESLGPLRRGLDKAAIVAAVGEPSKADPPSKSTWGQWGVLWSWPEQALQVVLVADDEAGPYHSSVVVLMPPGTGRTARGLAMGASVEELRAAYGENVVEEKPERVRIRVGGDELTLMMSEGKVIMMVLGPAR